MSKSSNTMATAAIAARMSDTAAGFAPESLQAIGDRATARIATRVRALRLSQQLGVTATIDESGWLNGDAELHYKRGRGGTIQPLLVRVGKDAPDALVLASGGVLARCREYNGALDLLRQLGLQLAALVRDGRIALVPGTPVAAAHDELAQLDVVIARRQAIQMGHSIVRLDVLAVEVAYFRGRGAELARTVQTVERAASATWEGDTEDVVLDAGCDR
jgi:hypothetical protein